jgi:DNA replication protein DnaC
MSDQPEQKSRAAIERERTSTKGWSLRTVTGWPDRYRQAVETPPQGEEWLSAFDEAREAVSKGGIVVFYGKRGSGKTRMAAELAVIAGSSRYRTAMRFFLTVRATFKRHAEKTELEVIDELATTPLLVLDEIQERGETGFEDRLLTHLIDARYAANLPTVLIANLTKKELAASLGDSIVSRAQENGKSIEFNWESYRKPTP